VVWKLHLSPDRLQYADALQAIRPISESLSERLAGEPEIVRQRFMVDLHNAVIRPGNRIITIRAGAIVFGECSTFEARGGQVKDPRFCSRENDGTLYFEVSDSFFRSTSRLYLCARHRDETRRGTLNFREGNIIPL
jgi:hypothetical protein